KGFPIMNNNRAELTFDVKDDTVKSYEQSAMEDILPSKGANNEPRQVISAHKAIEALYYNQYLKHDQEVENIRLGYYTVVKETNIQVLQANWEIKVKDANGTHTYYVEAISSNPQIIEQ
ncbi:TPA: two-component system regulatory protein YycI, partial [Staphylococcus delphini]|nr:two-component system regulatory protein YycI [Staphylococcus delphini]